MNNIPSSRLLSRVLVPLLIIALPIAGMTAFILYGKQAKKMQDAKRPEPAAAARFGARDWTVSRGDVALTGTAEGNLPERLKLAWRFKTNGRIISAPVVYDSVVFVASMDGRLYAVQAQSGRQLWQFAADDELEAGPLYYDGVVYAGSTYGTLYAVDARTGKARWSYEVGGKITGAPNIMIQDGKPAIVFGSHDNNLYYLHAADGKLLRKVAAQSYINGAPAISESNMAAFGSCDGYLYLLPADGEPVKIDADSYIAANPAFYAGLVYAGNYEGLFLCADVRTGEIVWSFNETQDAFFSSPAVNEDVAVVGCRDGLLYCFDRHNGALLWTFEGGDRFDSSPVICGRRVAAGNHDGRLYLADMETGREVFSYTLGSPVSSGAAVADNMLFIGCENGYLYAFTEG